ncbi:urease accessory protein UreD [Pseudonocardia sp. TRM90224]|uniref:urease accessory protein UreD n=1 Tax=Pseudonocardia sp. TRM90224 TaxID=2812678 RepID=UPI001E2D0C31|nr:urease accessory protein UreD [Pseudonocardia sp. TRM90224]
MVLRPTGERQVHLVQGAGGPLGGDALSLDVDVCAGAELRVRSAGATLVQAGTEDGPARWATTIRVRAAGRIDWAPEPTIVSDGASLESWLRIELAGDATAAVREVVVLGRHGQRGGRYRGAVNVTVGGRALLTQTTLLDGADPALAGPGGSAGARAVGTFLLVGAPRRPSGCGERSGVRWAWSALAGPGDLLTAVGEPGAVGAVLEAVSPG